MSASKHERLPPKTRDVIWDISGPAVKMCLDSKSMLNASRDSELEGCPSAEKAVIRLICKCLDLFRVIAYVWPKPDPPQQPRKPRDTNSYAFAEKNSTVASASRPRKHWRPPRGSNFLPVFPITHFKWTYNSSRLHVSTYTVSWKNFQEPRPTLTMCLCSSHADHCKIAVPIFDSAL